MPDVSQECNGSVEPERSVCLLRRGTHQDIGGKLCRLNDRFRRIIRRLGSLRRLQFLRCTLFIHMVDINRRAALNRRVLEAHPDILQRLDTVAPDTVLLCIEIELISRDILFCQRFLTGRFLHFVEDIPGRDSRNGKLCSFRKRPLGRAYRNRRPILEADLPEVNCRILCFFFLHRKNCCVGQICLFGERSIPFEILGQVDRWSELRLTGNLCIVLFPAGEFISFRGNSLGALKRNLIFRRAYSRFLFRYRDTSAFTGLIVNMKRNIRFFRITCLCLSRFGIRRFLTAVNSTVGVSRFFIVFTCAFG